MFCRCLFVSLILFISPVCAAIHYLTWKGDPARTMTITWQEGPSLDYKLFSEERWYRVEGQKISIGHLTLYRAELTGLEPDTSYMLRLSGGEEYQFRTLPEKLDRPLKVAIGGDAYYNPETNEQMNKEVASREPDFVIMAGDIAYTEGIKYALRPRSWKIDRWAQFFEAWSRDMVTKEGRLIPIVATLGNHDIREGLDSPFREQVLFYQFFVFPVTGVPYQVLKIGQEVCFYLLDSGHSFPIGGAQTEWLEKNLKENCGALFHIPVYHIAAYPSETSFTHRGAKDIRKFWVPLFEKYGVKVTMEHDNHTFKRTYPIKEGKIDPEGIYYLGDGAWGVTPLKPQRHWYLAKAAQCNCYWLVTITPSQCQFQAFNLQGQLIDEVEVIPQKQPTL
ncbi:MAG: metallophosphoesterase [Verrucomicrobia bacterium]|nr:metallophosphoesterase [Verrucomicrobiota bacterium]